MLCSSCKANIAEPPADGICPQCGHLLGSPSAATEIHMAATLELPQTEDDDSEPGPQPSDAEVADAGDQTAATIPLPSPGKMARSMSIAPRKLSMRNMELITNTWQGAAGDATGRTSLKLDSKATTGMGSSLVVNPRGVRSAQTRPRRPSAPTTSCSRSSARAAWASSTRPARRRSTAWSPSR